MEPSGPSQQGSSIEDAAPGSDAVETIAENNVVVANEAVSIPAELDIPLFIFLQPTGNLSG